MLCGGLVSLQCVVVLIWSFAKQPKASVVFPAERKVVECEGPMSHTLFAQSLNIVLCIVTTAYTFLTRKLPSRFVAQKK